MQFDMVVYITFYAPNINTLGYRLEHLNRDDCVIIFVRIKAVMFVPFEKPQILNYPKLFSVLILIWIQFVMHYFK